MDSSIIDDLGVAGDDELFAEFDKRFGVDSPDLDYKRFFGNEGMYPWAFVFMLLMLLWGLVRIVCGKPFAEKRKAENDMKVSDLVETAINMKWNERFESGPRD